MFFVFHGSLDNPKSIGTNRLIKEYAKIVLKPEDITKNYKFLHKIEKSKAKQKIKQEYENNICKIITEKPIDINDIAKSSNMTQKEVMSKLTILELEGKIKKVAGNRYIRGDFY